MPRFAGGADITSKAFVGFDGAGATAAQHAKKHGVTLTECAKMIGADRVDNLRNWHKSKPLLFHAVVVGCAEIKHDNAGTVAAIKGLLE